MTTQNKRLMLTALALGAFSMPAVPGAAEVVHRSFGEPPVPRQRGYRQGRRWGYGFHGFRDVMQKGGNPAGTKLAKKMAKGTLTICGIR